MLIKKIIAADKVCCVFSQHVATHQSDDDLEVGPEELVNAEDLQHTQVPERDVDGVEAAGGTRVHGTVAHYYSRGKPRDGDRVPHVPHRAEEHFKLCTATSRLRGYDLKIIPKIIT